MLIWFLINDLEFECEVSTCRVEAGREGLEATASSAKHTWVIIFIIQWSTTSILDGEIDNTR